MLVPLCDPVSHAHSSQPHEEQHHPSHCGMPPLNMVWDEKLVR